MGNTAPYGIEKVVYSEHSCIPQFADTTTKYIIYPDGKITVKHYGYKSGKLYASEEYRLTAEKVLDFYRNLVDCVMNAEGWNCIEDDCSGKFTIYYPYEHTETFTRELKGNGVLAAEIISDLIKEIHK